MKSTKLKILIKINKTNFEKLHLKPVIKQFQL